MQMISFHCLRMFLRLEYILTIQWAEVLSADAFSAFEDAGLDNNKVRLETPFYNVISILQ